MPSQAAKNREKTSPALKTDTDLVRAYLNKKKKKPGYEREKTSPALKRPARSSSSRKPKPRKPQGGVTIRRGEVLTDMAERLRTTPAALLAANPGIKFATPGLVLRPPRGGALGGAYGGGAVVPAFKPPSYETGRRKSEDVLPEARPPERFAGPRPARAFPTTRPNLPPPTAIGSQAGFRPPGAAPIGTVPTPTPTPAPILVGPARPPTSPIDMNDAWRARAVGANWYDIVSTIQSGGMPLVIYEEAAAQLGIDADALEKEWGYTWDENTHKWISPEFLKAEGSQPDFSGGGGRGGARNAYGYGWGYGGGGGGGGGGRGGGFGYPVERDRGGYMNGFGLVSWRI